MATIGSVTTALNLESAAFIRDLNKATSALNNSARVMGQQNAIVAKGFATLQTTAESALNSISNSVGQLNPALSGLARSLTSAGSALGVAGTAAVAAGASFVALGVGIAVNAIPAARDLETEMLRIEAVLRATGSASGLTSKQIQQASEDIGSSLGNDEAIRAAAATLLTFRSIAGETFTQTLSLANDLAATGFGSVESAAVALGKALEEPETGLTALRRVGVSFSESQKQLIKSLVETGQQAEAQRVILEALENQVGGVAAGTGSGLTGATGRLADAWNDFLETIGERLGLLAAATRTVEFLTSAVNGLADAFDSITGGGDPASQLQNAVQELADLESKRAQILEGAHKSFGTPAGVAAGEELAAIDHEIQSRRDLITTIQDQLATERIEQDLAKQAAADQQKQIVLDQQQSKANAENARVAKAAAAEQKNAAEVLSSMLVDQERENSQLNALKRAYDGYGSSVERVEETIEAMNDAQALEEKLRAAKIPLINAEVAGLLDLASKNGVLRRELEKRAKIEKEIAAQKEASRTASFQAMNEEEMRRRTGQASAGGLSSPGLPTEEELSEPFKNALQSVQAEFTSTFEEISQGTIRSFEDMAQSIHGIFTNMSANIASLLIFDREGFDKFAADISKTTGLTPGASGNLATGAAFATPTIGLLTGLFGNQGAQEGLAIGGGAGTLAGGLLGLAIGGPGGAAVGSLAGGLLGSIGGSVFGGLFGGGGSDKTKGSFSGGIGNASFGGSSEISNIVKQVDKEILSLLDSRQRAAVARLKDSGNISVSGGLSASDVESIGSSRIGATAKALGFNQGAILRGDTEQALKNLQTAIATQRAIEDLTDGVSKFDRQVEDLSSQFAELRSTARQFGISLVGVAEANTKAYRELIKAQDAQIKALLDPFAALSGPLEQFQKQLEFSGLGPAAQFEKAQAEFDRISGLAEGGDIAALGQLQSAGEVLIGLAERFGASPGGVAAREDVAEAVSTALERIEAARDQAESSIQDEVRRASREEVTKLDQLIESVEKVVTEIRRSGKKVGA